MDGGLSKHSERRTVNREVQPRHFLIELFSCCASTWFEKNTSIRRKVASGASPLM